MFWSQTSSVQNASNTKDTIKAYIHILQLYVASEDRKASFIVAPRNELHSPIYDAMGC